MVSFTLEQNIILQPTQFDDIMYEKTIICGQLFAGHLVDFRPMKRKKNWYGMIMLVKQANQHKLKGLMLGQITERTSFYNH